MTRFVSFLLVGNGCVGGAGRGKPAVGDVGVHREPWKHVPSVGIFPLGSVEADLTNRGMSLDESFEVIRHNRGIVDV